MDGVSLIGVDGGTELAPRGPDLLSLGIHNDDLSVSGLVEASGISIEGLSGDFAVSVLDDGAEAGVA